MTDTNVTMNVTLQSNIAEESARAERAVKKMTTAAGRDYARLRTAATITSDSINKLGKSFAKMTNAKDNLKNLVQGVVDMNAKLATIGVRARLSGAALQTLKKNLFDIAQDPNVRLSPKDLMSGFDALVAKTGDVKFAQTNIKNLGLAMRATGASTPQAATIMATLRDLGITEIEDVTNALGLLNEKSKDSGLEFTDFANKAVKIKETLGIVEKGCDGTKDALGKVNSEAAGVAGNQLVQDAATNASTMAAALTSLSTALTIKADNVFAGTIQSIADAINDLSPEKLNALFDIAAKGAAAAAVIIGVNKAIRGTMSAIETGKSIRQFFSGSGGKKGAASALASAGATPVFVTNWPLGGGYGGGDVGLDGPDKKGNKSRQTKGPRVRGWKGVVVKAASSLKGQITRLFSGGKNLITNGATKFMSYAGKAGSFAGRVATPLLIATKGAEAVGALIRGDTRGAAGAGGALAGGLAGAQLGGMIGAFGGPVGLALGGLAGGLAGAYLGEEGVKGLMDYFDDDKDTSSTDQLAESINTLNSTVRDNNLAHKAKADVSISPMHSIESLIRVTN